MDYQIVCVKKDYYGNITHIGYQKYPNCKPIKISIADAIYRMKADGFSFYVVYNGKRIAVDIKNDNDQEYLFTNDGGGEGNYLEYFDIF